jgi:NTE family protein
VEGARQKLHDLWRGIACKGRFSPLQRTPWDMLLGRWSIENSPSYFLFNSLSRAFSPYIANPFNINPVRDVIEAEIDFDCVRSCTDIKLFVSATNVETGKLRVFRPEEIDADVVMASACLPHIFQAVFIDGAPYWDGGYGGNPAIFPFFRATDTEDVLLVQINPVIREGAPRSATEIQNRIDEITFNAALLREFRAIAFVKKLIAAGCLKREEYRDIRMHRIDADMAFKHLSASSKIHAEWAFLEYLRDLGRTAAEDWLEESFEAVGKRPTLDLSGELEDGLVPVEGRRLGKRVREFLARRPKPTRAMPSMADI